MPVRSAEAEWTGNLREGKGRLKAESGAVDAAYGFQSRFETGPGTNPEELIAAAHAGCFSMALSGALTGAGHPPTRVRTGARVHIEKQAQGFAITRVELRTEVDAAGLDDATFQDLARKAKDTCPVSKALAAVEISLVATLGAASP